MSDAKRILKGGAIVAGSASVVAAIAAFILLPAVIAIGWFVGWWGFEPAVIALLVLIAYFSGDA